MLEFFLRGGDFMWLLLIMSLVIIVLTVKKIYELFYLKNTADINLESGINAIIFWGGISALVGVLGQLAGIYMALSAIIQAADISPQIVMLGFQMSFISTLSGFVILLVAALIWFLLRWRYKTLIQK